MSGYITCHLPVASELPQVDDMPCPACRLTVTARNAQSRWQLAADPSNRDPPTVAREPHKKMGARRVAGTRYRPHSVPFAGRCGGKIASRLGLATNPAAFVKAMAVPKRILQSARA